MIYWKEFEEYWLEVITEKTNKMDYEIIDVIEHRKPFAPNIYKSKILFENKKG